MGLEFFLGVRIVLIMFTRAHTNPFLLVCTSGFLWMAHIHLHISSLFGILPTYIHLCGMLLWVLNESNFKREVISETQHIRMIPLDLQLHRHVYFLIFFFLFNGVNSKERWDLWLFRTCTSCNMLCGHLYKAFNSVLFVFCMLRFVRPHQWSHVYIFMRYHLFPRIWISLPFLEMTLLNRA